MPYASITLPRTIYYEILYRAQAELVCEVCGLVGGKEGQVSVHLPLANAAADPRTRYAIAPADFVRAYRAIEQVGDLIGIYHSHPRGTAVPSPVDIAEATWLDVAYLIVGLGPVEPELRAWDLRSRPTREIPIEGGRAGP